MVICFYAIEMIDYFPCGNRPKESCSNKAMDFLALKQYPMPRQGYDTIAMHINRRFQ